MTKKATLREALTNVSLAVKKLKKDSTNKFGGYDYVSIDSFYEGIVQAAAKEDLWWHIRQGHVGLLEGRPDIMRYVFGVDIYHGDDMLPNFDTVTVDIKMAGGQTAGIARSFAEKAFMRTVFKIRTGEPDGGELEQAQNASATLMQQSVDNTNKTEYTDKELEDIAATATELQEQVKACNSADDLFALWVENESDISKIQDALTPMYDKLIVAFKRAKTNLTTEKE